MITQASIATAVAENDTPALEAAFAAFVAYPAGEALTGFSGPDAMIRSFTDDVCQHLFGDLNPLPEATHDAVILFALEHYTGLLGPTFHDAAAMCSANHLGFLEQFSAGFAAAPAATA